MIGEVTGSIDFTVGAETYQTWYKLFGDLKSGVCPLIALHGGPGMSHDYMLSHVELCATHGIPVLMYDQVGIGKSTHLQDKPAEFWTVDLFMDELDNVLAHFDITEFDVLGHSWGGMLAATYASRRKPAGLRRLVLGGTPASMELYQKSTRSLLERLPQDVRETLKKHEEAGTTDDPEYQKGMEVFSKQFICKLDPWPEEFVQSFAAMDQDPTVYKTMIGVSEFYITGSLDTWSVVGELHNIGCPTLVMNGRDDSVQDIAVFPFFKEIPKVKWVTFENSSHMVVYEEKDRYFKIVGDFLTAV